MTEKLKKDVESLERLKKLNTELSVAKATSDSALSDLNDKVSALSEDRNLLERELAKQQSQLQRERDERIEVSKRCQELDSAVHTLTKEITSIRDQMQATERKSAELNGRLIESENAKTSLQQEISKWQQKYDHLAKASSAGLANTDAMNNSLGSTNNVIEGQIKQLESQLTDQRSARETAERDRDVKERELSMLRLDFQQQAYKLEQLAADSAAEVEKSRNAIIAGERLREEKSLMQSDYSVQASEITLLKTNEKRLMRDIAEYRERAKSLEEELHKVRAARSVDDLQRKELEDQLEAEQYFSTLYKTQVRELQDEVDEAKDQVNELERELENHSQRLQQAIARGDSEALSRRVLEEDIAELEKEKMMVELEVKDLTNAHKVKLRNLEMQLEGAKDNESDLLQRIDLLTKDQMESNERERVLKEELDSKPNAEDDNETKVELVKLQKLLSTEKLLKQQAVNKLMEVMNRKGGLANPKSAKPTSSELRKKEKENRRLQQELTMEKEKFNQLVAQKAKEQQDLQALLYEESQRNLKISMELATKESDVEQLQMKLAHMNLDAISLNSGLGGDAGDPPSFDNVMISEITTLEGWLQVPSKQNIRRHGWKKLFVVVSSKKIIFFNSETERQNADPQLILDLK